MVATDKYLHHKSSGAVEGVGKKENAGKNKKKEHRNARPDEQAVPQL